MNITEIQLSPNNQLFTVSLGNTLYQVRILWRDTFWCLDLMNNAGDLIIGGLPVITGADLLAQYTHLGLGFSLLVMCDVAGQENPTQTDLGSYSHLYVITE